MRRSVLHVLLATAILGLGIGAVALVPARASVAERGESRTIEVDGKLYVLSGDRLTPQR